MVEPVIASASAASSVVTGQVTCSGVVNAFIEDSAFISSSKISVDTARMAARSAAILCRRSVSAGPGAIR